MVLHVNPSSVRMNTDYVMWYIFPDICIEIHFVRFFLLLIKSGNSSQIDYKL